MKPAPLHKLDPVRASKTSVIHLDPYIPGRPVQEIKKQFGLDHVVKLASNENDMDLPQGIKQAIIDGISSVSKYPDGNARELKAALAADLGILPESLLFGNGAEEVINMIGQAFLNPGDESIIPDPSFDSYRITTEFMEGIPVYVPLKDDCIDLDAVLSHVTEKTKIVWLCSPNNPTGTVLPQKDLDDFLSKLPDDIVVVLDQAYWEYMESPDASDARHYLETDARIIGVRTFSKVFGLAGLRIGYLLAHPRVTEVVAKVRLSFNVNTLAQAAALAALKETDFKNRHLAMIREQRTMLISAMKARGIEVRPTQTNFIMIPLPFNGDKLFKALLPKGMIIRPGSVFNIPNAIRLSIGTPEENLFFLKTFDEAMAEMDSGER